jgi:hypothetical protein
MPHLDATVVTLNAVWVFYDAGVPSYRFAVRDWVQRKSGLNVEGAAVPSVVDLILRGGKQIGRGFSTEVQLLPDLFV